MEFLVVLGILAALALFVITLYNRLVALRQNRMNAYSDIDVQLKQRFDLIPQLVETVKAYAGHERAVFETVTAARAGVKEAASPDARLQKEAQLSGALFNLLAVAENYPILKADGSFQKLMAELSDIENKIAAARRFFNNATSELNTSIQQFPSNIIARTFGFQEQAFYEDSTTSREALEKAPAVRF